MGVVQRLLPPPPPSGVVNGDASAARCPLDLAPSRAAVSNSGFVAYPLLDAAGSSERDALEPAMHIPP